MSWYDGWGRCLGRQRFSSGAVPPQTRLYRYSIEGDLLQVLDSDRGATHFDYDAAHRLSEVRREGAVDSIRYDSAGNLLEKPGLTGVSVAPGNRLRTANRASFEYDHRHHLSTRYDAQGTIHYHYDALDMLCRIDGLEAPWEAGYDALGRRSWKTFGTARSEYWWDGDRVAAELMPDGRLRVFVYAHPLALTPLMFVEYGSIHAEPDSGACYFLFCDQRGAPVRVEDGEGQCVWSASLEPYGLARIEAGQRFHMPLRFPGHWWDDETGLHYNRFRYYSPELGRYLQSDPLGIGGGINLYAYTVSPLTQVDVRGLGCGEGDEGDPDGHPRRDGPEQETTAPPKDGTLQLRNGSALHGQSEGGPGTWVESPSRTKGVEYQEQITGVERGTEYNVDGVLFDGYDAGRNVLLDSKDWRNYPPSGQSWWQQGVVDEAQRQLLVSGDTPIEWHFPNQQSADAVSSLFQDRGIEGIDVVVTPST